LILGVFIGQGSGNDTDKLAAALAAQKPPVVNVGGGGATTATATADVTLTSDYSLAEGYAVQLQTIPQAGADQAAVDAAKAAATAKGATAVGFINPSDHAVTPDPGADKYVIYSGEFKKKPDAEKALKKLKAKFPDATVVAVKASAGEGGTELGTGTNGKAVHSAKDYKPSAKRVAEDKKKVEDLQDKTGEDYRKAQNDLPAEIDIPGDPNNAPALPDPSAPQP
jgi:hypothetical protein